MRVIRFIAGTIAGYLLFIVLLLAYVIAYYLLAGRDPHLRTSLPFIISTIGVAALAAFAAGFVATLLSRSAGFVVAGLIFLQAAITFVYSQNGALWSQTASLVLLTPAAIAGAVMCRSRKSAAPEATTV